jgi:hypothetical protein
VRSGAGLSEKRLELLDSGGGAGVAFDETPLGLDSEGFGEAEDCGAGEGAPGVTNVCPVATKAGRPNTQKNNLIVAKRQGAWM